MFSLLRPPPSVSLTTTYMPAPLACSSRTSARDLEWNKRGKTCEPSSPFSLNVWKLKVEAVASIKFRKLIASPVSTFAGIAIEGWGTMLSVGRLERRIRRVTQHVAAVRQLQSTLNALKVLVGNFPATAYKDTEILLGTPSADGLGVALDPPGGGHASRYCGSSE